MVDSDKRLSVLDFADGLGPREEVEEELHEWETWVTCRIGGTLFGVPVRRAQEVLRVSELTRVPHAPFAVRGVTNLRGQVLPVLDLRLRLGLDSVPLDDDHRIIVVGLEGRLIGLLVDSVEQVEQIDRLRIEDPPEEVVTTDSYYISGVYQLREHLLVLLDTRRVLDLQSEPGDAASDSEIPDGDSASAESEEAE